MSDVRCTKDENVILVMDVEEMKKRTKEFAINVAKLMQKLPDTLINRIYKGQIIRSSSSAGANYRASRRAKSKADFIPLEDEQQTMGGDNDMPLHDNIRGEDYYQ